MAYEGLPGADLVEKGLADLAEERETPEALLVSIGVPRLRAVGTRVPDETIAEPERRLTSFSLSKTRTPRTLATTLSSAVS